MNPILPLALVPARYRNRPARAGWRLGILALLLLAAVSGSWAAEPDKDKEQKKEKAQWHFLAQGKLASVAVEKALYEANKGEAFYMCVRITNGGKKDIGVELEYWKCIHPNQWGAHPGPERIIIDEERMVPTVLDKKVTARLMAAFKDRKLTVVPAGKSLVYFREFNGPAGRDKVDQQIEGKNLIVSMDGELLFTDGEVVDQVHCEWKGEVDAMQTDVVLGLPPKWKPLPKKALVVTDE